jgi:protein transport protein SEC61 subunit alpha
VFGIIITVSEAVAYVASGMYGDVKDLGLTNAFLIVFQLFCAGIIVLVLVSDLIFSCIKRKEKKQN